MTGRIIIFVAAAVLGAAALLLALLLLPRLSPERARRLDPSRPRADIVRPKSAPGNAPESPEGRRDVARLETLAAEFAARRDWSTMIAIGDVYMRGSYPRFQPDEGMAVEIFTVVSRCAQTEAASVARARRAETLAFPVDPEDRAGARLPRGPGEEACRLGAEALELEALASRATPARREGGHVPARTPTRAPPHRHGPPVRLGIVTSPLVSDVFDFETAPLPPADETYGQDKNDRQNVHDHGVTTAVGQNVGVLAARHDQVRSDGAGVQRDVEGVMDAILNSDMPDAAKADAVRVMDSLGDTAHSRFGLSEKQVLASVWREIRGTPDETLRNSVVETLVKQIAESVERGSVVCSSGKISRFVGALEGTGVGAAADRAGARPVWAIREELAALAARTRDRHPGEGREEAAAAEFASEARAVYVDNLGLSDKVIGPIIEEYRAALAA